MNAKFTTKTQFKKTNQFLFFNDNPLRKRSDKIGFTDICKLFYFHKNYQHEVTVIRVK